MTDPVTVSPSDLQPELPVPLDPDDRWADLPAEGTAVVYTRDPRYLPPGESLARVAPKAERLPFGEEDLASRYGGGLWAVKVKDVQGRFVRTITCATLGPDLLAELFRASGVRVPDLVDGAEGGVLGTIRRLREAQGPATGSGELSSLERQIGELRAAVAELAKPAPEKTPGPLEGLALRLIEASLERDRREETSGRPASALADLREAMEVLRDLRPPESDDGPSFGEMMAMIGMMTGGAQGHQAPLQLPGGAPAPAQTQPRPAQPEAAQAAAQPQPQAAAQPQAAPPAESAAQLRLRSISARLLTGLQRTFEDGALEDLEVSRSAAALEGLLEPDELERLLTDRDAAVRGTLGMLAQASPDSVEALRHPAAAAHLAAIFDELAERAAGEEEDEGEGEEEAEAETEDEGA